MAEYVMSEMEAFVEACGDVAMDNFDPAAFEADPSAAFADTMGAVMDYMGESGMPPEMMEIFKMLLKVVLTNIWVITLTPLQWTHLTQLVQYRPPYGRYAT